MIPNEEKCEKRRRQSFGFAAKIFAIFRSDPGRKLVSSLEIMVYEILSVSIFFTITLKEPAKPKLLPKAFKYNQRSDHRI